MKPILNSWLASSADPAKLATTVTGILISLSSIIIAVLMRVFGVEISTEDFTSAATAIGVLIGAIATLYGILRKITIRFGSIR